MNMKPTKTEWTDIPQILNCENVDILRIMQISKVCTYMVYNV